MTGIQLTSALRRASLLDYSSQSEIRQDNAATHPSIPCHPAWHVLQAVSQAIEGGPGTSEAGLTGHISHGSANAFRNSFGKYQLRATEGDFVCACVRSRP